MASRYYNSNLYVSGLPAGDGELSASELADFEQSLLQSLTDEDKIDLLPILRFAFPSLQHTLPKQQSLYGQQCPHSDGYAYINGMTSTASMFSNFGTTVYRQNTRWIPWFWNPYTYENSISQGTYKNNIAEFPKNSEATQSSPSVGHVNANVFANAVNQFCSSSQFHGTGTISHRVDASLGLKGFNAGCEHIMETSISTHGSALPGTSEIAFRPNIQVPQLIDHECGDVYVDDEADAVFNGSTECADQGRNSVHFHGFGRNLQKIKDRVTHQVNDACNDSICCNGNNENCFPDHANDIHVYGVCSNSQKVERYVTRQVNDICNGSSYSNNVRQSAVSDPANSNNVHEAYGNSKNIEDRVTADIHLHNASVSSQNIEDGITIDIPVDGACDTDEYGSYTEDCLDYQHNVSEIPRSLDLSSRDNDCETDGGVNIDRLQFPKANRKRRKINRKGVGWVKKRVSTPKFSSRMRHKRECSLPCCTGSESGVKKRKLSEFVERNEDSNNEDVHVRFPSYFSAKSLKEKPEDGRNHKHQMDKYFKTLASDCHENSVSQAAEDWLSSPLRTALVIVLLESGDRGASASEILGMLNLKGYSKVFGLEKQLLVEQIKSTLCECPDFKELRAHRFMLKDCSQFRGKKQFMINALLRLQNANAEEHDEDVDEGSDFSNSDVVKLQEVSSQEIVNNCSANSCSETKCSLPEIEFPLCRKTDGRQWRCTRAAMAGFLYCARHQQPRRKSKTNKHVFRKYFSTLSYREGLCVPKEEEKSDTGVGSCSEQSMEQENEVVAQHRCCRTDGKNWQCVNRAMSGTMYCKHHEKQTKKAAIGKNSRDLVAIQAKQNDWPSGDFVVSGMYSSSMRLRSRPKR